MATRRALFSSRAVVFYCDLSMQTSPPTELPKSLRVERKRRQVDLDQQDLNQIINMWNPKLAQRRMSERFAQGASLWLIKFDERLAGCGWTLQGRAIAPYYFPLTENDVQFFDFHVFPKYRGRAIDWFLMTHILQQLALEGAARAFAEAAEWNQASLSSIQMTSFRLLGRVRAQTILGQPIVRWDASDAAGTNRNAKARTQPLSAGRGKKSKAPAPRLGTEH